MNTQRISSVIGILLICALLLSACSFSMPGQQSASKATPTVVFAPFKQDLVIVEGRLLPNQTANLAFSASGLVKELNVAEGDEVKAGQVIASLDGAEQLQASIQNARYELLSARQEIDALNDNYANTLASAQQKLVQSKIDLEDAQEDRTSMTYRRASDATLDGIRADVILAQEALDKAQNFYDHNANGDSLIAAQALRDLASAKLARDRALYNLDYATGLPDKNDIDQADAAVRIAEANLETARKELDRLASGPDAQQMALAVARQQAAEVNLNAAEAQLKNLDVKAPLDGTIVNLQITLGEQVNPGQGIATLADFSKWVVETSDLTELNVVQIRPGQAVTLIADALPDEELTGTVERISNAYVEKQGDVTYTVRIALDQGDERLRWGMTLAVEFDTSSSAEASQPAQQDAAPTASPTDDTAAQDDGADAGQLAENAVEEFFAALENKDAQKAAGLLSNYSLVAERTTLAEVTEELEKQLASSGWSNLTIQESKVEDDATTLVHVQYQVTAKDAKTGASQETQVDEWWPVRLENGQWRYSWQNVLDYRGFDLPGQTMAGLTISPVQLTRCTDRMKLVVFAQNRTNDAIVLGQTNENLALFYFDDQAVEAENEQLVIEPMRTYPEAAIVVKGSFASYPEKVEIRKWKGIQAEPWYSFEFSPGQ